MKPGMCGPGIAATTARAARCARRSRTAVSSPTSMARASSATMLSSLVVTASSLNFRAFHHSERRGTNKQVLARGTNLARAPPLFVQDFAIKRVPRAPFVQDFAIRRALNRQPALGGSLLSQNPAQIQGLAHPAKKSKRRFVQQKRKFEARAAHSPAPARALAHRITRGASPRTEGRRTT